MQGYWQLIHTNWQLNEPHMHSSTCNELSTENSAKFLVVEPPQGDVEKGTVRACHVLAVLPQRGSEFPNLTIFGMSRRHTAKCADNSLLHSVRVANCYCIRFVALHFPLI